MRSVIKTFKSLFTKNVDIFRIKIKNAEEETFEKNKKDLINNIVI